MRKNISQTGTFLSVPLEAKLMFSLLFVLASLILASCEHADLSVPKPNENLRPAADFIKNNYDFRMLYAALEYTDLVDELNGPGPFTVLAVNDAGFNAMGIFTVQDIHKLDRDSLRQALLYHVLKDRRLMIADIPTNAVDARYETLSGDELYLSAGTRNARYYFDGAGVKSMDIILANGVLHVLNKAMQYHKASKVQDYLSTHAEYSIFVAGLKKFGLWEGLSGEGPFTVFAPNDSAFANQGITQQNIDDLNTSVYHERLFNAYIMYGKHYFISDKNVFYIISEEYTYKYIFKDDDYYLTFGMHQEDWFEGGAVYPTFSVWKPTPNSSFDERLRLVYADNSFVNIINYDHRLENGLVHDLHDLLILPEQALTQSPD